MKNSLIAKVTALALAVSLAATMTACGSSEDSEDSSSSVTVTQTSLINEDMFSNRDYDTSYEDYTTMNLSSMSGDVEITEAGTYLLTGTLKDGQVRITVGDDDKVQLVLDNVTIENSKSAAIYVTNADKVFITTTADSTNTISSSATFKSADSETGDNVDATIWSKCTLTMNGEGTLNITCDNAHGVCSKDNLKVTSGTYKITAGDHGLDGKDSVRIGGGTITITAGTDGIHSDNDEDEDKGFVYICAGKLKIAAEKQGIEAYTNCTIDGGDITITKSYEGIEAQNIFVNDGNLDITASDDGFNAAGGNDDSGLSSFGPGGGMGGDPFGDTGDYTLEFNGGTTHVNADGDGLDSNGSLVVNGGTIYVDGPTNGGNGALDSGTSISITGGTVVAIGASGMDETFDDDSEQASIRYVVDSTCAAGTKISLKDADGNVIVEYTSEKTFNSVVISSPDITSDGTYTLTIGSNSYDIDMDGATSFSNSSGNTMGGGMGGGMAQPGGNMGGRGGKGGPQGQVFETATATNTNTASV